MKKYLSIILSTVVLAVTCLTSVPMSIVSADSNVIFEENFSNYKLGTIASSNQGDGKLVTCTDETKISTGYTWNGEPISEMDIVQDSSGRRALRMTNAIKAISGDNVAKIGTAIPASGKYVLTMKMRLDKPAVLIARHTMADSQPYTLLKLQNNGGNAEILYGNDKTETTGIKVGFTSENEYKVILDASNNKYAIYLNNEKISPGDMITATKSFAGKYLYLMPGFTSTPAVTYNEDKDIATISNSGFVYIYSMKLESLADTALTSVAPANGSSVLTPKKATFNFNNNITSAGSATISVDGGDIPVTPAIEGNTVSVPYEFIEGKTYTVTVNNISDGFSTVSSTSTTFTTESWSFSNIENPVVSDYQDASVYYVNEDFNNSTTDKVFANALGAGWSVNQSSTGTAAEFDDRNCLKLGYTGSVRFDLINAARKAIANKTLTYSFDVYIDEGVKQFQIRRYDSSKLVSCANWQYGYFDYQETGGKTAPMGKGDWHKMVIAIKDKTDTKIYVDGEKVLTTEANPDYTGLETATQFQFLTAGGTSDDATNQVLIDNLKIGIMDTSNPITEVSPAFDAADVPASAQLKFTYAHPVGDVSDAVLTLKDANDENIITLTNGSGMTATVKNNTVIITLDDALEDNTGYGVQLSGIKSVEGDVIESVKTRFSTVPDASWTFTDLDIKTASDVSNKIYELKLKHKGDTASAQMIVALFDENEDLTDVAFSDKAQVSSDGWTTLSAEIFNRLNTTYKVMVWDSVEEMNPVTGVFTK